MIFVDHGRDVVGLGAFSVDRPDLVFRHFALVEIGERGPGTLVRWDPSRAPFTSIARLIDLLPSLRPPIWLEFYVHGWLNERHDDWRNARRRVEQASSLVGTSPITDFFKYPIPRPAPSYVQALKARPSLRRECVVFSMEDGLPIRAAGAGSLMARTLGPDWIQAAANDRLNGYSSGVALSASGSAYRRVANTGDPCFDRVLTRVVPPGKEPRWLAYDRAIWVELGAGGHSLVNLCTERSAAPLLFTL